MLKRARHRVGSQGAAVSVCLVLVAAASWAADYSEVGHPFAEFYERQTYGGHSQNWGFVQDDQGLLYAANNHGVLIFDGARWSGVPTPSGGVVRALARDSTGRIWVGAQGEIGYLAPDPQGEPQFVSILDQAPEEARQFSDCFTAVATPTGVYLQTREVLFRWREDGLRAWLQEGTEFHRVFYAGDRVLVARRDVGLLEVLGDELEPLEGSEELAGAHVNFVVEWPQGDLLIGTGERGLFTWAAGELATFETAAADLLRTIWPYKAVVLSDNTLAIGSIRDGILVLSPDGSIVRHLSVRGLPVLNLHVDHMQGLWLALDGGIARLELPVPLSYFDQDDGLPGGATAVARHRGVLYLGTRRGLARMQPPAAAGRPPRFEAVPSASRQMWALLSHPAGLFVGTHTGLFLLQDDDRVEPLLEDVEIRALAAAAGTRERVYVAGRHGLMVLEPTGGEWRVVARTDGVTETANSLAETPDGAVWLGSHREGVLRVAMAEGRPAGVERFGPDQGLPDVTRGERYTVVFDLHGGVIVGTPTGIFRYDKSSPVPFGPDPRFPPGRDLFRLARGQDGRLWIRSDTNLVAPPIGGGWTEWDARPFARLPRAVTLDILPEPGGVVWLATDWGLVRYDDSRAGSYERPFSTVIRRVTGLGADAAVLAGAAKAAGELRLETGSHSIRLQYGATAFDAGGRTRYQTRMEGLDAEWSPWTEESHRDFTNIPPGKHRFRVRARNIHGTTGAEARLQVVVPPPWYRTGLAYSAFALLALAALAGSGLAAGQWQRRQAVRRERHLEALIRERTGVIEAQKEKLEVQARELERLDASKSRFFANISHEFRTPLTLILGSLTDLLAGRRGDLGQEALSQLDVALRSSRRLLALVEELLDLARLEAGKLVLERRCRDFGPFVQRQVEIFRSYAESRNISLEVRTPGRPVMAEFDAGQMRKVVANLLSNAIKFTPAAGRVDVVLEGREDALQLRVSDSGPGIPPEALPRTFDRFFQVGDSATRRQAGAGIGLALARELVELHGGSIEAASDPGRGATFTVTLARASEQSAAAAAEVEGGEEPGPLDLAFGSAPAERSRPPALPSVSGISAEDVTTVLLVDDHPDLRAWVRRHLEASFRVIEAADGREGLELARRTLPDLIVSDVMMPEMDGHELCREIKADPELDCLPVILLTARSSSGEAVEGLSHGADDYVAKPFDVLELEARVRGLIASRRHLKARWGEAPTIRPRGVEVTSADEVFLGKVREVLEEHLDDPEFSVERLAREVAMERSALYRRLRALLDESPSELLRRVRLERAAQLLAGRAGTVTEVAYGVGFASLSHFSKCFRELYGMSPSTYAGGVGAGQAAR